MGLSDARAAKRLEWLRSAESRLEATRAALRRAETSCGTGHNPGRMNRLRDNVQQLLGTIERHRRILQQLLGIDRAAGGIEAGGTDPAAGGPSQWGC